MRDPATRLQGSLGVRKRWTGGKSIFKSELTVIPNNVLVQDPGLALPSDIRDPDASHSYTLLAQGIHEILPQWLVELLHTNVS